MSVMDSPSTPARTMARQLETTVEEVVEEVEEESAPIKWINIIFLPFHSDFELVILCAVVIKCIMGPLKSVHMYLICPDKVSILVEWIMPLQYIHENICTPLFFIDTSLRIIHRQIKDEATKREHPAISCCELVLNILAIIPFYRLLYIDKCPQISFWPNILVFMEVLIIYRIPQYFTLYYTHRTINHLIGFILLLVVITNCLACTILLVTNEGLCRRCADNPFFDWRLYVIKRFTNFSSPFTPYMFAVTIALTYILNATLYEVKPSTYSELAFSSAFMIVSYFVRVFLLVPKLFAEAILRMRRIMIFHSRITRIIEETKRRNPSPQAHISVKNFYYLMWKNRTGITTMPHVIADLPRYLRLHISEDLVWSVFRHSPTLRSTSIPYQRSLCEYIKLEFKLPGEKLYAGLHCYTNLVYLKSGVVQFISSEDNSSPYLSVTSGTLLGDISFYLPPLHRKVVVRCLTYCEIFVLSRSHVLRSLHKFPKDRKIIIESAKTRIEHARSLYAFKESVRGTNRKEDECVDWIKKVWWELSEVISNYRKSSKKSKCEIPMEKIPYHCPKYIGQLVLCSDVQLRTKSVLADFSYPWMLLPDSYLVAAWTKFVLIVIYLVLVLYPPNIIRREPPVWFECFKFCMNFIYVADVIVSLVTACEGKDRNIISEFRKVLIIRCNDWRFVLDVCSTFLVADFMETIASEIQLLVELSQFNSLLKTYQIFLHIFNPDLNSQRDPMKSVCYMIFLINFVIFYVGAYFFYVAQRNWPDLTTQYFFGRNYCTEDNTRCELSEKNVYMIFKGWLFELVFASDLPKTKTDIGIGFILAVCIFTVSLYSKSNFMAALYLKIYEKTNYYYFVSNLKNHYKNYKIHPHLMKRLDTYLTCHWKYFHGLEVLQPNNLKEEPYDIYWKIHGEIAESIMGNSRMFKNADTGLIKELAYRAKFLILPKSATLHLFGVQCKVVMWIVNGEVQSEFYDSEGNLVKTYAGPGEMLSLSSVFMSKTALVSYIAATECEVLFIQRADFLSIIRRYPEEWAYIENAIRDVGPDYEKVYQEYFSKHHDYQLKLQEKIFHQTSLTEPNNLSAFLHFFTFALTKPGTVLIQSWLLFRAIVVALSIVVASLKAGGGAFIRMYLNMIGVGCDLVGLFDITLKCFMPYYNDRGVIIYSYCKCITHYLIRGFILDCIGTFPVQKIIRYIMNDTLPDAHLVLINLMCKYAHLYLITGYFNYIADVPTVNIAYVTILKWQVVTMLLMFGASSVFVTKCILFKWDADGNLVNMVRLETCWVPHFIPLNRNVTINQFHMVVAESINLAQCALLRINLGLFQLQRESYTTSIIFVLLGVVFWYIVCLSQTLMVLNNRADSILQHSVNQLKAFLEDERVDKKIIERSIAHLNYWWIRTSGLHMQNLMGQRIGVVFKQDLNYYFFRKTFEAMDKQLNGGKLLHRLMANMVTLVYFLAGEDIIREMDLTENVYIVHRGQISINRHGKKLATLRKGGIFGQMEGGRIRPVRITAHADENTDLLQISIKNFQEIISEVKGNIAEHPEFLFDYIPVKEEVVENAYNTIQYILRVRKKIKLPWMKAHVDIKSSVLYGRWLILVWLWLTTITITLTLALHILPGKIRFIVLCVLIVLDFLHFTQFLSEFYTMKLVVVDNKCVNQYVTFDRIYSMGFLIDLIALAGTVAPMIVKHWMMHWLRLFWLLNYYRFYRNFCQNIQSTTLVLKIVIVFLIFHALTCGWIYVSCQKNEGSSFIHLHEAPPIVNITIDRDEWMSADVRKEGCFRVTRSYTIGVVDLEMVNFVMPTHWVADYLVAFNYVVLLLVNANINSVVPVSVAQVYYKSLMTIILYLVEMWLTSVIISAMYTKYRELYEYDSHVEDLVTYFQHNGTCKTLLASVKKYTTLLWQRHRGHWLPEITKQASLCLREDILSALYMHHLQTAPLFKQLPPYFLRQLVVRMRRIVIFPGKFLVQAGDMLSCVYFIHEGEVEKCTIDFKGDYKTLSVLTTNGYFGIMPGLFPNIPYQHYYYTRTVVDLIYLRLRDWQDLLNGYPEIKYDLYLSAKKFLDTITKENLNTQGPST